MAAHRERERFQADHVAGLAGRAARLRAAVYQQPGLPPIQEESRPADQGTSRVADCWSTTPASNGILASRRIRLLVRGHLALSTCRRRACGGRHSSAPPSAASSRLTTARPNGPGFFGVVLGPVLDRRIAAPRHADGIVLAGVARERPLQRDLVFPVGSEVVGVADLPARLQDVPDPDRVFVRGPLQARECVGVLLLPRLEQDPAALAGGQFGQPPHVVRTVERLFLAQGPVHGLGNRGP